MKYRFVQVYLLNSIRAAGCGQVVGVHVFYSGDPSLNIYEAYIFPNFFEKRTKINEKVVAKFVCSIVQKPT